MRVYECVCARVHKSKYLCVCIGVTGINLMYVCIGVTAEHADASCVTSRMPACGRAAVGRALVLQQPSHAADRTQRVRVAVAQRLAARRQRLAVERLRLAQLACRRGGRGAGARTRT